jgi:hypothetical protein
VRNRLRLASTGRHQIAARRPLQQPCVIHGAAELGRDHDIAAARAQYPAQKILRSAAIAVIVGGVEERDAGGDRLIDDGAALLQIAAHGEIVATQADCRHEQVRIADFAHLHEYPILENRS